MQRISGTCPNCGVSVTKVLSEYKRHKTFFCSQSCAASYNNKQRSKQSREKQRKTLKSTLEKKRINGANNTYTGNKTHTKNKKVKRCIVCGSVKGQCPRPDVCSSGLVKQRSNNLALLGFDFSCYGTLGVIEQFEKIKALVYDLYVIQEHSIWSIMKLYKIPSERTFISLFKTFGITARSASESQQVSLLRNRRGLVSNGNPYYKRGYHTTWEGKVVYYRSSYELDYCLELDEQRVGYDMEVYRIKYYDTVKDEYHVAVPDFYIASENKIVEVKSYRTYDRQNMIDKRVTYQELGYNFELVLEHVSYGSACPPDKPNVKAKRK